MSGLTKENAKEYLTALAAEIKKFKDLTCQTAYYCSGSGWSDDQREQFDAVEANAGRLLGQVRLALSFLKQ